MLIKEHTEHSRKIMQSNTTNRLRSQSIPIPTRHEEPESPPSSPRHSHSWGGRIRRWLSPNRTSITERRVFSVGHIFSHLEDSSDIINNYEQFKTSTRVDDFERYAQFIYVLYNFWETGNCLDETNLPSFLLNITDDLYPHLSKFDRQTLQYITRFVNLSQETIPPSYPDPKFIAALKEALSKFAPPASDESQARTAKRKSSKKEKL